MGSTLDGPSTLMQTFLAFLAGVLAIALLALAGGFDDADARRADDSFIPAGVNCPGHF